MCSQFRLFSEAALVAYSSAGTGWPAGARTLQRNGRNSALFTRSVVCASLAIDHCQQFCLWYWQRRTNSSADLYKRRPEEFVSDDLCAFSMVKNNMDAECRSETDSCWGLCDLILRWSVVEQQWAMSSGLERILEILDDALILYQLQQPGIGLSPHHYLAINCSSTHLFIFS